MCCDGKCFFFIKVRTGTLIMGYIAAVLSAIGVLVAVGLHMFLAFADAYGAGIYYGAQAIHMVQLFFVEVTAGFTFTVLLLNGITENKPVFLKTYIIYGMIHLVLLLIVMIVLLCSKYAVIGGVVLVFVNGIYVSFIYMVYLTYKIMVSESMGRTFTSPPNLLLV